MYLRLLVLAVMCKTKDTISVSDIIISTFILGGGEKKINLPNMLVKL